MTRRAISPRFAIRIFLNMLVSEAKNLLPQRHRDTEEKRKKEKHSPEITMCKALPNYHCREAFSILLVFSVSLCLRGKSVGSHVDYFFGLMANSSCPYSMGALFATSIFTISPATSDSISFINFIASTMHRI